MSDEPKEPRPTIEPTTLTQVAVAAMAGFGAAWLALATVQNQGGSLPLVGPIAWISVGVIAAGIGVLAFRTYGTVHRRKLPIEPKEAVTRLLLGKTSILGGVGLGAAYGALVWLAAGGLPAPLHSERVIHGGAAVLACAAWALAGWFLERACRIPGGDSPDTPADEGNAGDSSAPPVK